MDTIRLRLMAQIKWHAHAAPGEVGASLSYEGYVALLRRVFVPPWDLRTDLRSKNGLIEEQRFRAIHDHLGVALYGRGLYVRSVQFSCPRLAFTAPHNGQLIRTEEEFARGLSNLENVLSSVMHVHSFLSSPVLRLDIATHFYGKIEEVIKQLRDIKFPTIRKEAEVRDNSIVFPGAELRVIVYDKGIQLGFDPGIIRIELQFTGGRLNRLFGLHPFVKLGDLTFAKVYTAVAHLGFAIDIMDMTDACTIIEKIAIMACAGVNVHGIDVLTFWLRNHSSRYARRFERQVRLIVDSPIHKNLMGHFGPQGPLESAPDVLGF